MDYCLYRNDGEMLTEELCEKESRGLPSYARNDINGFSQCAGMTKRGRSFNGFSAYRNKEAGRGYIMDYCISRNDKERRGSYIMDFLTTREGRSRERIYNGFLPAQE